MFTKDGAVMVLLTNQEDEPRTFLLKTTVPEGYAAVQHSTRRRIPLKDGVYSVAVNAREPDAVLLIPSGRLGLPPRTPEPLTSLPARHPILRWRGGRETPEHYEIRLAAAESGLETARIRFSSEPRYQIAEALPPGPVFFQVRALNCNGAVSSWSVPGQARVAVPPMLDYRQESAACGSMASIGTWQCFSWGGGSALASCSIDPVDAAPGDTASLRVDNEFETTESYWTLFRNNGCHGALREASPEERYTFSARLRTRGDIRASIKLCAMSKTGSVIRSSHSETVGGDHWTAVSASLVMPADTRFLNCYFSGGRGKGTAWMSDVRLERIE